MLAAAPVEKLNYETALKTPLAELVILSAPPIPMQPYPVTIAMLSQRTSDTLTKSLNSDSA